MAQEDKSGFWEVAAIIALLLFMWKMTHKKQVLNVQPAEPVVINADEELDPPGFDLNTYCEKIVYRPLTSTNLAGSSLLPNNWCVKGDTDIVDKDKGFGDAYADKQAQDYQAMKDDEATLLANKNVIQFRLINDTNAPITTNILNATQDPTIFIASLAAPVISGASGITESAFTANFDPVPGAPGYYLDVATDSGFISFVPGYQNLDIGNNLSRLVSGLASATNYYYRARARNSNSTGTNSNTGSVKTKTIFNDFFLPARDEMQGLYTELYMHGLGGFNGTGLYTSSSEVSSTTFFELQMVVDVFGTGNKNALNVYTRPIRSFISAVIYNLRDTGPSGGLIFHITDNGDGTFTYYEAYTSDIGFGSQWSNITSTLIGTTGTAIGTGKANSAAIIAQAGHITSAALLCKNLTVIN